MAAQRMSLIYQTAGIFSLLRHIIPTPGEPQQTHTLLEGDLING